MCCGPPGVHRRGDSSLFPVTYALSLVSVLPPSMLDARCPLRCPLLTPRCAAGSWCAAHGALLLPIGPSCLSAALPCPARPPPPVSFRLHPFSTALVGWAPCLPQHAEPWQTAPQSAPVAKTLPGLASVAYVVWFRFWLGWPPRVSPCQSDAGPALHPNDEAISLCGVAPAAVLSLALAPFP